MVAVKAHQADAFLKALDRVPSAVLFYGTDAGLVSERSARLAQRLAEREEGEILRLDDADLENDPERISVELQTAAMFGGRKVVRALAGRRINANALRALVEGGNLEGFLIVEAGNLRPDEALRAAELAESLGDGSPYLRSVAGRALARVGRTSEAQRILESLDASRTEAYVPSQALAVVHEALGDSTAALRELWRAYDEKGSSLVWIKVDPWLDRLRPLPAFSDLMRRMGLETGSRA